MNFDLNIFNEKCRDFIEKIEKDFGHEIKIEYHDFEKGHGAGATINELGVPII